MRRPAAWLCAAWVLIALPSAGRFAQEQKTAPAPEASEVTQSTPDDDGTALRGPLDAIREDLVGLNFEKALAAIESLLAQPGMTETDRGEALVLRSQAHVAIGDLKAAEEDYRQILAMRPAYVPDSSLTPRKAMERFERVQRKLVGSLRVSAIPEDARLYVDGRETLPQDGGVVRLLAGEHEVRGARAGFDPSLDLVQIVAGQEVELAIQLVPNARTVVLRSEPDDVEVWLDGERVGRTARPAGGLPGAAAELIIENVPLGDHRFELRRECFRAETIHDNLTVDLLDQTPKQYRVVSMIPSLSTVSFDGGTAGAEILIDGDSIGRLPLRDATVCAGRRTIEARLRDRTLWRSTVELVEGTIRTFEVEPRPNAVLLGADEWPAALGEFGRRCNASGRQPLPDGADLGEADGWRGIALAPDTDLALAVLPAARAGAGDRWLLYSPILRRVAVLGRAPDLDRPTWQRAVFGVTLVDSRVGGVARVATILRGSPAETAGLKIADRIVALDGTPLGAAAELRQRVATIPPGEPLEVEWLAVNGERRKAELVGTASPELAVGPVSDERAIVRAAWAVVDTFAAAEQPAAQANLALLFFERGEYAFARDAWRRVRWGERTGIGEGTTQFYLARALELLGREAEAVEAYRQAAGSRATAFHDHGPQVAPAARDRLIDLGVR